MLSQLPSSIESLSPDIDSKNSHSTPWSFGLKGPHGQDYEVQPKR